jgi:hypothetical protein
MLGLFGHLAHALGILGVIFFAGYLVLIGPEFRGLGRGGDQQTGRVMQVDKAWYAESSRGWPPLRSAW